MRNDLTCINIDKKQEEKITILSQKLSLRLCLFVIVVVVGGDGAVVYFFCLLFVFYNISIEKS